MVYPYCIICKGGRGLCGVSPCPLLASIKRKLPPVEVRGREIFGSSPPEVFVGRHNYPNINIGPLLPPVKEDTSEYILGSSLWGRPIEDVYAIRTTLIRGKRPLNVRAPGLDALSLSSHPMVEEGRLRREERRTLEGLKELALSVRPVDCELWLNRTPRSLTPTLNRIEMPFGPSVDFRRFILAENPKTLRPVERAVYDSDMKAEEGVWELYLSGVPLEKIVQLLSVGSLGVETRRRLVPTRWSITATDDILFRKMRDEVASNPPVDSYLYFYEVYAGNHIHVVLQPGPLQFEMMEQWQKGAFWGESSRILHDYEGVGGRKDYAREIEGAYYAARLAAAEYLRRKGRCATITVIRRITGEYWAPLGVWVIRETTRRALMKKPLQFNSKEELIEHLERGVKIPGVVDKSRFLKRKIQTRLF